MHNSGKVHKKMCKVRFRESEVFFCYLYFLIGLIYQMMLQIHLLV